MVPLGISKSLFLLEALGQNVFPGLSQLLDVPHISWVVASLFLPLQSQQWQVEFFSHSMTWLFFRLLVSKTLWYVEPTWIIQNNHPTLKSANYQLNNQWITEYWHKNRHRSMDQHREPQNKATHLWSVNLWQRRQEYTWRRKRQSLQQVVLRKLESFMQNNEIRTFSNIIYKNELKMD